MTQPNLIDEPPVAGLRERKKRETRERILDTARVLFADRGFAATKVEDITAALDLSPATLFNYFGNKDGLLRELADRWVDDFVAAIDHLEETTRAASSAPETLATSLRSIAEHLPATRSVNRRLYAELMRVTLPHESGARIVERVRSALARLVEAGQARGEIRTDLDPSELAEIIADLLTGTINNWLNDSRLSFSARLERAVSFLEGALRPVPQRTPPC